jgi:hypothetical protein
VANSVLSGPIEIDDGVCGLCGLTVSLHDQRFYPGQFLNHGNPLRPILDYIGKDLLHIAKQPFKSSVNLAEVDD